jgi:hypothetical protein
MSHQNVTPETAAHPEALFVPEPVLLNKYQDFSDLPPVQLRKGIDDEGNPWSPDLMIVKGEAVDRLDPMAWARRKFAGASFTRDFSGDAELLEHLPAEGESAFWVLRLENLKSRRKLLTVRLFAAPAGNEDEALAWTPIDKFLFEVEAKQQAAVLRRVNLRQLWQGWKERAYFNALGLPPSGAQPSGPGGYVFVAALVTDAEIDHPENVCHCGSEQSCNATAEGLDRRDPRYPFNQVFKHSIRTTFPLLPAAAMRMFSLG